MKNKICKILVTGADGQLGQCLKKAASENDENQENKYLFLNRKELNITSKTAILDLFARFSPDFVINTAGYTKVDLAEEEREKAFAINAVAVKHLALACKQFNAVLIHISTDYVFDGTAKTPYTENDQTGPKTVYGASKLQGEQEIVQTGLDRYYILRTSWLYSAFGTNFYKTILHLAETKKELHVVNDQEGSPTNANDLAAAIAMLCNLKDSQQHFGTYHYCNSGSTSWHGFAKAIIDNKGLKTPINKVLSAFFPVKAVRPLYSVLNCHKFEKTFGQKIPAWDKSLERFMVSVADQ